MSIVKIIDALKSCEAWLTRWGSHVAYCQGYPNCTCGLDAMRAEASIALVGSEGDEAEESAEEWRVAFAIAAADNIEHLGEEMDDVQQQYVKMARAALASLKGDAQ